MEYNFERIDIEQLIKYYGQIGKCDDKTIPPNLCWELISVTSTFNIANMSSEKIPTFKNMGCFNHYKNKNQVIIFGGVVQGSQMTNRSFLIDLEKQVISKGSDPQIKNGQLARLDRFQNHIYFKKDTFLYCFGEMNLHRFDLTENRWDQD